MFPIIAFAIGYSQLYTVNDNTFTIYATDIDDADGDTCNKICSDAGMFCPTDEITNTVTSDSEMDTLISNIQGINHTCPAYVQLIDFFKFGPYIVGPGGSQGCLYNTLASYVFECSRLLDTQFASQFCPCASFTSPSPPPSTPPSSPPSIPPSTPPSPNGPSTGTIVGIVLGAIAVVALVWFCWKMHQLRNQPHHVKMENLPNQKIPPLHPYVPPSRAYGNPDIAQQELKNAKFHAGHKP